MADNSSIEWTEATWNPILGCSRVSPGCDSCYAINTATIRAGNPHPKVAAAFAGLTERRDGRLDWTGRVNLLPERLTQPLRWRKPKRIFVNSQSDLFHDQVPDEYIAKVFAVMAQAPQHTFQLLTKRHARMRSLLNQERFVEDIQRAIDALYDDTDDQHVGDGWPLRNVWVGVSVENQQWADIRVPALLGTPAAVRWLSCEPLLGPVDLTRLSANIWQQPDMVYDALGQRYGVPGAWRAPSAARVDWVVVGGESGSASRPMNPAWARGLRDQCVAAGVPYFFKQWGEWCHSEQMTDDTWSRLDSAINLGQQPHPEPHRVGKKRAGRLLDGRTWDEYPAAGQAVAT